MSNSLSAAKRDRQNEKRRLRNKQNKTILKKELKSFSTALETAGGDPKAAFQKIQRALDVAARKNAIPKKRASRKKSRLAKALAQKLAAANK